MSFADQPTARPLRTRPRQYHSNVAYPGGPLRLDVEFRLDPEVLTWLEEVVEQGGTREDGRRRARAWLNSPDANPLVRLMTQVYLASASTGRLPEFKKPGALRGFFHNPLGLTFLAISSALFILGALNLLAWVAGL